MSGLRGSGSRLKVVDGSVHLVSSLTYALVCRPACQTTTRKFKDVPILAGSNVTIPYSVFSEVSLKKNKLQTGQEGRNCLLIRARDLSSSHATLGSPSTWTSLMARGRLSGQLRTTRLFRVSRFADAMMSSACKPTTDHRQSPHPVVEQPSSVRPTFPAPLLLPSFRETEPLLSPRMHPVPRSLPPLPLRSPRRYLCPCRQVRPRPVRRSYGLTQQAEAPAGWRGAAEEGGGACSGGREGLPCFGPALRGRLACRGSDRIWTDLAPSRA